MLKRILALFVMSIFLFSFQMVVHAEDITGDVSIATMGSGDLVYENEIQLYLLNFNEDFFPDVTWYKNGEPMTDVTEWRYKVTADDIGSYIYAVATHEDLEGELKTNTLGPVGKAASSGYAIDAVLESKTYNSVTIDKRESETTYEGEKIDYEYAISDEQGMTILSEWISDESVTFTGLTPETTYYFVERAMETSVREASEWSTMPLEVTTDTAPSTLSHNVTDDVVVLDELTEGYTTSGGEVVTITAEGTNTNVSVMLSGENVDSFVVGPSSFSEMTDSNTQNFGVMAANELAAGTYTATVTIVSDEFTEGVNFTVTQVVNESHDTDVADGNTTDDTDEEESNDENDDDTQDINETSDDDDDDDELEIYNQVKFVIIDQVTGEPVESAIVTMNGKSKRTNKSGRAYIYLREEGYFDYTVENDGYILVKGSFYSPAEYTMSMTKFTEKVALEAEVVQKHYEFYESDLNGLAKIFIPYNKDYLKTELTVDDIMFDRVIGDVFVTKLDRLEDGVVIELGSDQELLASIDTFFIMINPEKYVADTQGIISCNIIVENTLILYEDKVNISRIKLVSTNIEFSSEITKDDIYLEIAGNKINNKHIAVKEVYFINENEIQVKLYLHKDLEEDIKDIVITIEKNVLSNKEDEVIYFGTLMIIKGLPLNRVKE